MMHGMTGNSEMMRPFAEKVLPDGWNLLVPQAEFSHPNRGYTWWRYEGGDNPGRRILTAKELSDVDSSLLKLVTQLPDDELVLGGFSQGGAMAQELLQFDLNIKGIIAIGTRVVRPLELKSRLTRFNGTICSGCTENPIIVFLWKNIDWLGNTRIIRRSLGGMYTEFSTIRGT